jgi:hypothetical protein
MSGVKEKMQKPMHLLQLDAEEEAGKGMSNCAA